MSTITTTLDRDLATGPVARPHGTRSLLRRFWGVPGTIFAAALVAASAQIDAVEAARLACGPLLIGLGG